MEDLGQKKTSLGYGCQMAKMLEKADTVEELILQVRDLYQRGDAVNLANEQKTETRLTIITEK